jgi:hypothetical protein
VGAAAERQRDGQSDQDGKPGGCDEGHGLRTPAVRQGVAQAGPVPAALRSAIEPLIALHAVAPVREQDGAEALADRSQAVPPAQRVVREQRHAQPEHGR